MTSRFTFNDPRLIDPTPIEEEVARFLCQLRAIDPDKNMKCFLFAVAPEGEKGYFTVRDRVTVPGWVALLQVARELIATHKFLDEMNVRLLCS